ncbi:hypothetical protein FALBO_12984 [Fusarium albosuccineum]|uniref:Uncharacterized protein n=1 Tax=Fusarium albosuccineum TaxID=1237068 RepID=A0A8H4L217_9HYPO|nr:hypothetical protein FALBO_12984 [Fusarium albosuccineum]
MESLAVDDDDGDPLTADAVGDYYQKMWRKVSVPDSVDNTTMNWRKCQVPLQVIHMLTRCCFTTQLRDPALNQQVKLLTRLGVSKDPLPSDHPPSCAVVGISGITGEWVFARKPSKKKKTPAAPDIDMGDNLWGLDFKTEPSNKLSGENVIWHENMTVPGNIGQVKSLIMRNDRDFHDEAKVISAIRREHRRLTIGLPPRPLCHHRPGSDDSDDSAWKPNLARVYSDPVEKDSHFALRLPPLGVLVIDPEILNALKSFLWTYPQDPMPVNLALQALFVYSDLDKRSDSMAEGFASGAKNVLKHPVPHVALPVLIIYWPHFLRFHEVHKLTRYMHPLRFISIQYGLDTYYGGQLFSIKPNALDTTKLLRLTRAATSASRAIPESFRIPVIPHSLPGTKLIWPTGAGSAQRGTAGLTALCLVNDIGLCGLPSYHHRARNTQAVAVTAAVAKLVLRSPRLTVYPAFVPALPRPRFWLPEKRAEVVALSGTRQYVGPFYQDIDAVPQPTGPPTNSDEEESIFSMIQLQGTVARGGTLDANEVHRLQTYRLRLARDLRVSRKRMRIEYPGLIAWEGMQEEVLVAVAENIIPAVAARAKGPTMPAPGTPERDLTPTQIGQILRVAGPQAQEDLIGDPIERLTTAQCSHYFKQLRDLALITPFWNRIAGMLSAKGPPTLDDIYNECSETRDLIHLAEKVLATITGRDPNPDDTPESLHHYIPGLTAQLCGAVPCCTDDVIISEQEWRDQEMETKFPEEALQYGKKVTLILAMLGNPDANSMIGHIFSEFMDGDIYAQQAALIQSLDCITNPAFREDRPNHTEVRSLDDGEEGLPDHAEEGSLDDGEEGLPDHAEEGSLDDGEIGNQKMGSWCSFARRWI